MKSDDLVVWTQVVIAVVLLFTLAVTTWAFLLQHKKSKPKLLVSLTLDEAEGHPPVKVVTLHVRNPPGRPLVALNRAELMDDTGRVRARASDIAHRLEPGRQWQTAWPATQIPMRTSPVPAAIFGVVRDELGNTFRSKALRVADYHEWVDREPRAIDL